MTNEAGREFMLRNVDKRTSFVPPEPQPTLLARKAAVSTSCESCVGRSMNLCGALDHIRLAQLVALGGQRQWGKGEVIFREGEAGKELYVIAKGTASVRLRMADTDRTTRLITMSPGTNFGELALLDQEARSATVEADEDLVCYVLTHEKFVMLTQREPAVAIKLLMNLSRELASGLRRTTRTIYELAS